MAVKEVPNAEREARRNLLRRIPFEKRREIIAILEAARATADGDTAPQIESEAAQTV